MKVRDQRMANTKVSTKWGDVSFDEKGLANVDIEDKEKEKGLISQYGWTEVTDDQLRKEEEILKQQQDEQTKREKEAEERARKQRDKTGAVAQPDMSVTRATAPQDLAAPTGDFSATPAPGQTQDSLSSGRAQSASTGSDADKAGTSRQSTSDKDIVTDRAASSTGHATSSSTTADKEFGRPKSPSSPPPSKKDK